MSETTKPVDNWVVVMTRPMSEEIAEKALRQFGYRVYCPRGRKLFYPHGRERVGRPSILPRWAGYLFAQDWRGWPSQPIRGVIGLLHMDATSVGEDTGKIEHQSVPAKMSDQDIHKIMGKEWRGELDDRSPEQGKKRTDIKEGDSVSIELASNHILAVIEDLEANGKAIIRAMMFGSEVRTRVDQRELEAVGASVSAYSSEASAQQPR